MGLGERQRRGGVDCSYHDRLMQVCWWVVHRKGDIIPGVPPDHGACQFSVWQANLLAGIALASGLAFSLLGSTCRRCFSARVTKYRNQQL